MTRIHGLDLARALAIIGMMAAHMGPEHFLIDGYPSALFAVLSGVSMGIIASRSAGLAQARAALLTRAVILVGLGVVLSAVQFSIAIVLTAIGVSFLLLLPVLAWRTRWQVVLLAALVILGPLIGAAQAALFIPWTSAFFTDLLFGSYPLTAWLTYTLLGLLIHRLALQRETWLLLGGLVVFGLVQGILQVTGLRQSPGDMLNFVGEWLQGEPHSGGLLDVLTSAGLVAAIIGACLLACRVVAIVWATYPLRCLGAMSLTVYVVHVVITSIANGTFLGAGDNLAMLPDKEMGTLSDHGVAGADVGWTMEPLPDSPDLGFPPPDMDMAYPLWPSMFFAQLVGFLVFTSLWRWKFRRGPAEWAVSRAVTGTVSPRVDLEPARSTLSRP
ncbi:hypothetical protein [Corynebacterium sp.]|uniref:hypothetical protein n=1 Tax=Corynebacterium sp. TaxID=1720 RepID=UPI0026DEFFCF|nr:hypothetical protein [Corynebacterium sp.]MDO5511921.1 hypothetical protein [Corynebacterium sp.]